MAGQFLMPGFPGGGDDDEDDAVGAPLPPPPNGVLDVSSVSSADPSARVIEKQAVLEQVQNHGVRRLCGVYLVDLAWSLSLLTAAAPRVEEVQVLGLQPGQRLAALAVLSAMPRLRRLEVRGGRWARGPEQHVPEDAQPPRLVIPVLGQQALLQARAETMQRIEQLVQRLVDERQQHGRPPPDGRELHAMTQRARAMYHRECAARKVDERSEAAVDADDSARARAATDPAPKATPAPTPPLSPPPSPPPLLPAAPAEHDGVRWLRLGALTRTKTAAFVAAHATTVEDLLLLVGTQTEGMDVRHEALFGTSSLAPPRSPVVPIDEDLDGFLAALPPLPRLRRLVLLRYNRMHHEGRCCQQLCAAFRAVHAPRATQLPRVKVLCSFCDREATPSAVF